MKAGKPQPPTTKGQHFFHIDFYTKFLHFVLVNTLNIHQYYLLVGKNNLLKLTKLPIATRCTRCIKFLKKVTCILLFLCTKTYPTTFPARVASALTSRTDCGVRTTIPFTTRSGNISLIHITTSSKSAPVVSWRATALSW